LSVLAGCTLPWLPTDLLLLTRDSSCSSS
jgi:hypothetical protein